MESLHDLLLQHAPLTEVEGVEVRAGGGLVGLVLEVSKVQLGVDMGGGHHLGSNIIIVGIVGNQLRQFLPLQDFDFLLGFMKGSFFFPSKAPTPWLIVLAVYFVLNVPWTSFGDLPMNLLILRFSAWIRLNINEKIFTNGI